MNALMYLFNNQSLQLDSPVFEVKNQVTVVAVGLQPDDYITFEVISVIAGVRSTVCGCRVNPATDSAIGGVTELQCPTCVSDTQQLVRLTNRNPVVIIDNPQNAMLRAIYHGDGIDMHTVTVWAVETDSQDLTDSMRGCPPVCCEDEEQTWEQTGEYRCTDAGYEAQEVSNCQNLRWVVVSALTWVATGVTRCVDDSIEQQEVNQCGGLRWVAGDDVGGWEATGATRCVDGNVEQQESSTCGIRWTVVGPETWTQTGQYRCVGVDYQAQEVNECGNLRWTTIAVVAWVATGATRCTGGNFERQESNQCGALRWTVVEAVAWTETGMVQCIGGFDNNQETNQCGDVRWTPTATPCGDSEGALYVMPPAAVPAEAIDDTAIATDIYGIRNALLGAPEGFIDIGGNAIPFFDVQLCCNLPTVNPLPANIETDTFDISLPVLTYGTQATTLGRPWGWINYLGYVLPYYGYGDCAPSTTSGTDLPTNLLGRRDALMGEPDGFVVISGYHVPYYTQPACPEEP
jgi:hypothetical protein